MARPGSRGRREREEERPARRRDREDDRSNGRRGREPEPRRPGGPHLGLLLGGVAAVVVAAVIGLLAAGGKRPPAPAPLPVVVAPPKEDLPPPKPGPQPKPAPKPLTADEKAYIEDLFKKAQAHIDAFRQHAKAGWAHKEKEENETANEEWIDAKHEFQKALGIVNEAMEDEERFPSERPGMDSFNLRLAAWQKEMQQLPKVNVTR